MSRFVTLKLPQWWCKAGRCFLALGWCMGLLYGILLFRSAGDFTVSLMRGAASGSVSIFSLLTTVLLPFLFTAFAVCIAEPRLLPVISFIKATCFCAVSLAAIYSFGSAGGLIRWMLMFAELMSLPFLYCFWLRHIGGDTKLGWADCLFPVWAAAMCWLDVSYISPFLAELVQY